MPLAGLLIISPFFISWCSIVVKWEAASIDLR